MNTKKGNVTMIFLVIAILVLGGFLFFSGNQNEAPVVANESDNQEITSEMMDDSDAQNAVQNAPQADLSAGLYEEYSPEKIAMAETGDVVLFFHATWCPSCQTLNADIKANMDKIPSDLTILKTDFDTYTELKNTYGVTSQHTLIQVDAQGEVISAWAGGSTLDSIISRVQ